MTIGSFVKLISFNFQYKNESSNFNHLFYNIGGLFIVVDYFNIIYFSYRHQYLYNLYLNL